MPRVVWLALVVLLFIFATLSLVPTYQLVLVDIKGEHPEMVVGEVALPLILYGATYWSWRKAGVADEQKEKKG